MSKNYDVTIKWHTPEDPTILETVVKTWASSSKMAEKIGMRGALLDGTIPADAIIDPAFPGTMLDKIDVAPAIEDDGRPLMLDERTETLENVPETAATEAIEAPPANICDEEQDMPDRFPPGTRVIVQISKRRQALGTVDYRVDARHVRVHLTAAAPRTPSAMFEFRSLTLATDEDWAAIAPAGKLERKARAAPSGDRKPSRRVELDMLAATGVMPTKPIMTSPTNKAQYQPRFDKLEAMAKAGDWDGVRAYEVKGINSYAKMVKQYRERLLAAHAASTAASEAA